MEEIENFRTVKYSNNGQAYSYVWADAISAENL